MKILIAAGCSSDRNLGVPGVMHCLADRFKAEGHEVRLRFRESSGRVSEALFGWNLARSQDVRWADIVDVHAVDAWPLCARRNRPAVIARSHGLERVVHDRLVAMTRTGGARLSPIYWAYRGTLRLWMEAMAVRHADTTFVLNASDREICIQRLGGDPERVTQIPNGFPARFLDAPIGASDSIAMIGSWIHRKGNDLAASALTTALRSGRISGALLLGCGSNASRVAADFPEDVRQKLTILPRFDREDLPSLLERSGILLFPSRSEGYPLSLVEAMACGLAPVATAIPGVVEVVQDGRSGLLAKPEDPLDLSAKLDTLLADPLLLRSLREGARSSVRPTSWDALAKAQLARYETILERRRRP